MSLTNLMVQFFRFRRETVHNDTSQKLPTTYTHTLNIRYMGAPSRRRRRSRARLAYISGVRIIIICLLHPPKRLRCWLCCCCCRFLAKLMRFRKIGVKTFNYIIRATSSARARVAAAAAATNVTYAELFIIQNGVISCQQHQRRSTQRRVCNCSHHSHGVETRSSARAAVGASRVANC